MKEELKRIKQYLLTGVSYTVPLIACGGILIALAILMAPMGPNGPDFDKAAPALQPLARLLANIGGTAFGLIGPVLAAFIAYGMVNKPGLVAGFVGGSIATTAVPIGDQKVSAGFLGAMVAGLLAGYAVKWILKVPWPRLLKPILPILIIPILSSLFVGFVMVKLNTPLAWVMAKMGSELAGMQSGSAVLLALMLGAMIAFDMGGPVNKAAFFFASGMIAQGNVYLMGPVAVAICVPPLGLGLATLVGRGLWNEQERDSGMAALGMGMCGITEGAIPFAAADPVRVIPCIMAGSMAGAVIAILSRVGNNAPHGGPIVIGVVENRLMFAIAIVVGASVVAILINALRWRQQRLQAASKNPEPATV